MESKEISCINNLIANIDCLEPLNKWTKEINIFNILKINRMEIRHSNMLAWLLSPNETHGLNDKFLKKLLIYSTNGTNLEIMNGLKPINVDIMDLSDCVVYREKNNIDILIVSEKNKLVFAIENKIGSGEHSNQLNRYREILQSEYGKNYHYVLVFLTPEIVEYSDPENWVIMSYDFILKTLTNLLNTYEITEKSKLFINDYIKTLRRNVVKDNELKEICAKIYYEHREAFDLIFENKPDIDSEISNYIYKYLKENESEFKIKVWDDHSKSYIRFIPNSVAEKYKDMGSGEWCGVYDLIGIEIQNFQNCDITINVIIGPSKNEYSYVRQQILDYAIASNWKLKGKVLRNKWKKIKSNTIISRERIDEENQELTYQIIDENLKNYITNEVPKIIKVLNNEK